MKTWHERIDEARRRGYFTDADATLANEWPTCACGEQDLRIPRHEFDNAPEDDILRNYGFRFNAHVGEATKEYLEPGADLYDRIEAAAEMLEKIEARAKEVLRELPTS